MRAKLRQSVSSSLGLFPHEIESLSLLPFPHFTIIFITILERGVRRGWTEWVRECASGERSIKGHFETERERERREREKDRCGGEGRRKRGEGKGERL